MDEDEDEELLAMLREPASTLRANEPQDGVEDLHYSQLVQVVETQPDYSQLVPVADTQEKVEAGEGAPPAKRPRASDAHADTRAAELEEEPEWMRAPAFVPNDEAPFAQHPAQQHATLHQLPRRYACDIEGDSVPVTFNGERVYLAIDPTGLEPSASGAAAAARPPGSLLGRPIGELLAEVEQAHTAAVMAESARLSAALLEGESDVAMAMGDGGGASPEESELWVDKYAPRIFTELLSDETTNRQVLQWLKAWDGCVFGVAAAVPSAALASRAAAAAAAAAGPTAGGGRGGGRGRGRRGGGGGEEAAARARSFALEREAASRPLLGADGRPLERLLLLAGPPGLGKTTLAHVAARHCGYRVVDVNASDERGAAALRGRLLDAVQMQPLTAGGRPNCVVLDEIDGALAGTDGRGALDAVVQLARIDSHKHGDEAGEAGVDAPAKRKGKRGAGGGAAGALQRPVLCICNDLMAPALRSLREVARVFRFGPPTPARLAARLRDIAAREHMSVDARALTLLAERTQCDVRAALHALQLLQRTGKRVTVADVVAVVGAKDLTVGPMDAWRGVYERRGTRNARGASAPGRSSAAAAEFKSTLSLLSTIGDHQLVLAGIHENLAHARYTDTLLTRSAAALEHMSDADVLCGRAQATSTYGLLAYLPLSALAVRQLVGSDGERVPVAWPTGASNARREQASRCALTDAWRRSVAPAVRATVSGDAASQLLPFLLTILGPSMRTMTVHAMSPSERAELDTLVTTMVSYGLSYTARSGTDAVTGAFTTELALDPPIDTLSRVEGLEEAPTRRSLVPAMRQVVAHECVVEHIRRADATRTARHGEAQDQAPADPSKTAGAQLLAKYASGKQAVKKRARSAAAKECPVFYRFHEGVTNAVRRPVLVRELL